MSKNKKNIITKITETIETPEAEDETPVLPIEEKDISEQRKIDKLFRELKTTESGFVLTLYKFKEHGKKSTCDKYYNQVPDLIKIRDVWGGGKYALYCNYDDKTFDYAEIELEALPEVAKSPGGDRKAWFDEMLNYRQLFASGGSGNNDMIEIMKINQANVENTNRIISAMTEKLMTMQIESEKRVMNVMQNQKGGDYKELLGMIDLIDTLRGGGEGERPSLLEKLLSSPAIQETLAGVIAQGSAPAPPPAASIPGALPVATPVKLIDRFSKNFVDYVTIETRDNSVDMVMKKLQCTRNDAESIIDQIIKEKVA